MIGWLKAIHIASLVIWSAGLLVLPTLLERRNHIESRSAFLRLQRLVRATFVLVASPAAFVAIAAGTALIFARDVFTVWMGLKLLAVGVLVGLHVRIGYVLVHLFEPRARYARWRQVAATSATVAAISAVLLLVLAKPVFYLDTLPLWLREPGSLQSFVETISPIP